MNAFDCGCSLEELLRRAGAKPGRFGKRWDCPKCGRPRRVSVDFAKELFRCWHEGCTFKGNRPGLARALGLAQKLSPKEARGLRERRERGKAWGRAAYERARARRLDLYEAFRGWVTILCGASRKLREDLNDPTAWEALARTYHELPKVQAELAILEDAPIAQRFRFLTAGTVEREERIQAVIYRGGVVCGERFIPLIDPALPLLADDGGAAPTWDTTPPGA